MIKLGHWTQKGNFITEYFEPEVTIGNFTSIADYVTFCGHMNHVCIKYPVVSTFSFQESWNVDYHEKSVSRGPIVVGNDVWIGHKAFIHDGVTIGDGAIIGALSNVTKDVQPYEVVGGNPIRHIRFRFNPEQIEKLLKIKWWDWDDDTIKERMEDFKDVDVFVSKYYES